MTTTLPARLTSVSNGDDGASLPARLTALAQMVQIGAARTGPDGIPAELLTIANDILARAGERLTLSSAHTVVSLAGGTGSGKSSLFNCLSGAEFSTVGLTRPVTREPHACVWGVSGSGPLLEWLGVPRRHRYARASALGGGEQSLDGLVLLDLPDHDTVMGHATELVDQLVDMSDLVIWVLDPQKYADAAVHRRFLAPLAGHPEVVAVVLNQADALSAAQVEDCVQDLRRLLDEEGLGEIHILVTSARTGAGIDELRKLLIETVSLRQAASARIAADVAKVVTRFQPYAAQLGVPAAGADSAARHDTGDSATGQVPDDPAGAAGLAGSDELARLLRLVGSASPAGSFVEDEAEDEEGRGALEPDGSAAGDDATSAPRYLPDSIAAELASAFAVAAGVDAIGDSLRSARELRALDYVGWPLAWLVERLTSPDPARKIRLGTLWDDLRGRAAGPSGAQRAELDNALTTIADERMPPLPRPWSRTVRAALRSRADELPAAIGEEIAAALPDSGAVDRWWRVVGVVQGLMLGCVAVGLAWLATLVVLGVARVGAPMPRLFSDVWLMPWAAALVVLGVGGGWLTARLCTRAVRTGAAAQTAELAVTIRQRLAGVARRLVLAPADSELDELARFRTELGIAAGEWPAQ